MASIYESPGQQVALTGPQTNPSFEPGLAYDPSRLMLQQSEKDLSAFAQFSDLLSRTLVERAKEENENQKNLGIADIVNGRMAPSPGQLAKYNNEKAILKAANDSTQETIEQVRTDNPDLAETMYQEAPAATGWRAYGQAIGIARKAASGLEAYMSDFLAGTDPIIPGPDGVLFAPAKSKTRAQLEASWEVGIQQYAQRAGLGNLNPVIIAAELTPIAMRTRSEMLGMQMQQIIATREDNEREDLRGSLPQQAELIAKDPAAAQKVLFDLNDKLLGLNRGNRQKANTETNEMMVNLIRILNDRDPGLAGKVKQHYEAALINPNNPKLGTYGQRFPQKELSDLIRTTTDQRDKEQNDEITAQAEGIVRIFYSRRNPANYREAIKELGALPQTPEVRAIIERLVNDGPDYDPERAEQLGAAANNLKELDALEAQGAISTEIHKRNSNRFAEEKAIKDLLPPDSAIKSKAKDYLKRLAAPELGRVPEYFDNASALAVEGLLQYAKATVEAELKSGKLEQKGGAINSRIEAILEVLAPDFLTGDKKNFLPSPKNPNLKGAVVQPAAGAAGGQNGRYLVDLVQSRVPRVTSAIQDISISPERWRAAYDVLESGGQAPADVSFAAKNAGVSVPEFLRQQASKVGETYDTNAIQRGNKVYQENRAISPRLAELIANPRTTPRMRDQYQIELQRLKQNQGTPLPTNERWMNDLNQLPQSQGTLPPPPPDGGEPMEIPSGGGDTQARAATRSGGGMTGITTYYTGSGGSDGVAGGPTANGEPYNPNAMTTAVQRSLRGKYLNKWLLVEDLDSGKSVRVWANDVGSMGGNDNSINRQDPRIIDLSPAAFKQLYGNLDRGTGRIRVRIDPNQRGKSPSSVR